MGCDSSSDAVSPIVTPSTFNFIFIEALTNPTNGATERWNLLKATTISTALVIPTNLHYDDFSTFATTIWPCMLMPNQCAAYDKISKKYIVSSGERGVIYDLSGATVPVPTQVAASNVKAMEFVSSRLFAVNGANELNEYTLSGTPVSGFSTINLPVGQVSSMAVDGVFLYVISNSQLYKIDTSGSGSIVAGYPITIATADYEGLEYINSVGCPNTLYAVKRNSGNEFVKISPTLGTVTTLYTLGFPEDNSICYSKISSALDYSTEFYYLLSPNGVSSHASSFTIIDLTPTNPSSYSPTLTVGSTNNFLIGLQLKD